MIPRTKVSLRVYLTSQCSQNDDGSLVEWLVYPLRSACNLAGILGDSRCKGAYRPTVVILAHALQNLLFVVRPNRLALKSSMD